MLVYGYPGSLGATDSLHSFGVRGEVSFPLLARGYAVFVIDIPMEGRGIYGRNGPLKDIVAAVEAGLDVLAANDRVDPKRMAIYGHSYGGYMVNVLLTRDPALCRRHFQRAE